MSDSSDTPFVQDYLECFGEVVRLVTSDQDVPDSLWARMRDDWAAMTVAERKGMQARIERRTGRRAQ